MCTNTPISQPMMNMEVGFEKKVYFWPALVYSDSHYSQHQGVSNLRIPDCESETVQLRCTGA